MGPVIRVISPVTAGRSHKDGRQLYYAYSSMAAALPGWDAAANRQEPTCSTTSHRNRRAARPHPGFAWRALLRTDLIAQVLDRRITRRDPRRLHAEDTRRRPRWRCGKISRSQGRRGSRRDRLRLAATAQVEAHCHARPSIREVRVYSPNARRREAFVAEMANKVKAKVRAVGSAEAAVAARPLSRPPPIRLSRCCLRPGSSPACSSPRSRNWSSKTPSTSVAAIR